jgi:HD-GYP domain-containing protein (c-di-GMP phosphodiesterase class II)
MFQHGDLLTGLGEALPLSRRLEIVHTAISAQFPFIVRIGVASYDPKSRMLKTYLRAGGDVPLANYQARLDDAPSLMAVLESGRPRVINDLRIFDHGPHEHTQSIRAQGYRSSYTSPMKLHGVLWGFLFFNSYEAEVFTDERLPTMDVFAHLITSLVAGELAAVRTLAAAVKVSHDLVHLRDPETGAHLDRMAELSRLIARQLYADGKPGVDDQFVEHLFLFAPLHDLGKIGIADNVLLKAGPLSEQERTEMRTHTEKGRRMIDDITTSFGLAGIPGIEILRNIAWSHHEALDGSGYPRGLHGEEVPLESRIVAVADVFDALTSPRPYKKAWSNADAFVFLRERAGTQLDGECVAALERNAVKVGEIQAAFRG